MEGFHRISRSERLKRLQQFCDLSEGDLGILSGETEISAEIAEHLIENVIGYFPIPLGVATYFKIDGVDRLIPMAVEETSIIAAASATAKWVRNSGQITTRMDGRLIIGQVQIPRFESEASFQNSLEQLALCKDVLIRAGNALIPGLVQRGGGLKEIILRGVERPDGEGKMLVVHLLCDPCDAMGANLINQVCEGLKPRIEEITGHKVGLCILSNLVDTKLAIAEVVLKGVDPEEGLGIEEASQFAKADPYRAATHNKGVLNGIDPILIATGNDWRAVEAGIHAYASRSGKYQPITSWTYKDGELRGVIRVPLAVGTVGGVTQVHPTARVAMKILDIEHSEELARICAAVGLVQNLGALRALATVGIVKGHMQLHTTNLALAAGAELHEISQVKARLAEILRVEKRINLSHAREILEAVRGARESRAPI